MARKKQYSLFHIVINSNQVLPDKEKETFKAAGTYLFSKRENLLRYIQAHRSRADDNNDLSSHISALKVVMGYEIGKKFHKHHLDVTLHIEHDSNLKLHSQGIRDFFTNVLGSSPYVHIQGEGNSQAYMEQYSKKEGDFAEFNL